MSLEFLFLFRFGEFFLFFLKFDLDGVNFFGCKNVFILFSVDILIVILFVSGFFIGVCLSGLVGVCGLWG